jgi:hypothetical protein
VVERYLKARPSPGKPVPFATLAELAALSPFQLAVLERSHRCTADASVLREGIYVMCRFYRALTPDQRRSLFSDEGLDAASLTHAQLHDFLDERRLRGGLEIHQPLQEVRGLRFRFREESEDGKLLLIASCARDGVDVDPAVSTELPVVEDEEQPAASR